MIGRNLFQSCAKVTKLNRIKIGLIGGTDSSHGSGLHADLQTVKKMHFSGVPAISAITLQNNSANVRIFPLPAKGFDSQLTELLNVELDAIKIGMLPDEISVQLVCEFLDKTACQRVVLDPVHSTSCGHQLISDQGWNLLLKKLLTRVGLVTPNLDEVIRILGPEYRDETDAVKLLNKCADFETKAVLLKGGHLATKWCTDVLAEKNKPFLEFKKKRISGGSKVRGTGCRLATAIACFWAKENDLASAVEHAGKFLNDYILKKIS